MKKSLFVAVFVIVAAALLGPLSARAQLAYVSNEKDGTITAAKVFVVGAGVAGLAAIGAASGLGAIVRANDTRPEVGDQVRDVGPGDPRRGGDVKRLNARIDRNADLQRRGVGEGLRTAVLFTAKDDQQSFRDGGDLFHAFFRFHRGDE